MTYLQMHGDLAHSSGKMGTVDFVVVHATVSPCTPGGARANARYFKTAGAGGLAQYVVDPGEVVQTCPEDVAGWHAPPVNQRAIGVELCDPQTGPESRWNDQLHQQMLSRAAVLVADLCKRHNIPTVHVDPAGLLAGKRGITMHRDVSAAWRKSTHTDPGPGFRIDRFITLVRQVAGAPTPAQEEFVMATKDEVKQAVTEALEDLQGKRTPDHKDTDPGELSIADVLNKLDDLPAAVAAAVTKALQTAAQTSSR